MHDSAFGRLIGVLVSPTRTFESIAQRPTWVAPLVVLLVLFAAVGILTWQRVDAEDMTRPMREAIERQGETPNEEQLEQAVTVQRGFGYGCSAVMPPVVYLLSALVLMVALKIAGGEIGFKTSFAVTLHGFMPWAIAALLTIPVVLARDSLGLQEAQMQTILASSAAAFAPEDAGQVLIAVLSSFDVFSFWAIALLTIGFSIAARVSRGKAAAVVTTLWLVWLVVKVGLAALGSAFGGG